MNRADFNQFLAVYHKQVATSVKKNVDKYSKKKHYNNEKIESAGGLDLIILWKILNRSKKDLAEYLGVGTDKITRYLKTRNLVWSTIIEDENEVIYKGKFGTLTSTGGDVKIPKKKKKYKKKPKSKWRKSLKKDRHRKYYHVTKHRNKNYKQGFVYRYSYTKNGKKQHIDNKDIKELERLVKAKGLKWEKIPMPFDYEIKKKKKEIEEKEKWNEYEKWKKENKVVE